MVKNSPAMWESWLSSLGLEDPLEKSMANHSSILAWRIPMDRGAWQAAAHGVAVLVAALGLSLVVASRGYSLVAVGARASLCNSFSCCGAQAQ